MTLSRANDMMVELEILYCLEIDTGIDVPRKLHIFLTFDFVLNQLLL